MPSKPTVLIVDDEQIYLLIYSRIMEGMGVQVLCAVNGVEALRMFQKHEDEIVLVIMDIQMPVMNGLEAFRQLRSLKDDLHVVIASGCIDHAMRKELDQYSPAGYLMKPPSMDDLAMFLKNAILAAEIKRK